MAKMDIQTEKVKNDILVIRLLGELDMYTVKELKEILESNFDQDNFRYIINVNGSDYIDSSGFALLLSFNSKLLKKGYRMRIVLNKNKSMLFNHFGVHKSISLFFTEEAAIESFL